MILDYLTFVGCSKGLLCNQAEVRKLLLHPSTNHVQKIEDFCAIDIWASFVVSFLECTMRHSEDDYIERTCIRSSLVQKGAQSIHKTLSKINCAPNRFSTPPVTHLYQNAKCPTSLEYSRYS